MAAARLLGPAVAGLLAIGPVAAAETPAARDPAKIVTAEACGECHLEEFEVWKTTPHALGFKSLHRSADAEEIARKMGHRLIKRDSPCLECHYTTALDGERERAVSGVSCESCHGAGRDWIEVHNDYGPDATFATETDAHREQRIAASRAAGMLRPTDLYEVAANCFGCHTVPNEELVNVGGHTTGSIGFELVEWSQGEIRHNFVAAQRGGSKENVERSDERKRLMYVVGRSLELEYALRGLAKATEDGAYAKSMIRKVRNAVAEVGDIAAVTTLAPVNTMTAAVREARVSQGNAAELLAAADRVSAATRALLREPAGAQVAALDPLRLGQPLPGTDQLAEDEREGLEDPVEGAAETVPAAVAAAAAPGEPGATTAGAGSGRSVPDYARKTRLRPTSPHRTIDAGACSGCHEEQNAWWFDDPHYAAAEPFHEGDPKNAQIARLYGLAAGEATRGNQLCMDCHGTVVTGKERREVWDGVSCQSCHGGAADYLEPHKEGDETAGDQRSGYLAALGLGMKELRRPEVRARNCASCHYITDPRLISAGHPTGRDFRIVERMPRIRHWERADLDASALESAFRDEVARRGAIPEVVLASLPAGESPLAAAATATRTRRAGGGSRPVRALPPRQRPVDPIAIPDPASVGPLDLPPFDPPADDAPLEEVLALIQQRLALIYENVQEP